MTEALQPRRRFWSATAVSRLRVGDVLVIQDQTYRIDDIELGVYGDHVTLQMSGLSRLAERKKFKRYHVLSGVARVAPEIFIQEPHSSTVVEEPFDG